MLFPLKAETGGQVDGIFVLQQPGFLPEGFVFDIEHIAHQVMPVKPAHPQPRHQQAEVTCGKCYDVQYGACHVRQGQVKQPPVQKEQHASGYQRRVDFGPGDFFTLDSMCSQTGYCQ